MLEDHIRGEISEKLGFDPTPGQVEVIKKLAKFIVHPDACFVFLLKGYAGTGKTSVISSLVQVLRRYKIRTVLLAPTGRAAKVLSRYAGKAAFTIHKRIYRQKAVLDGVGKFILDKNFYKDTIFVVDEASMVSNEHTGESAFGMGRLLDDLIEYVYSGRNCRLVFVGDLAQLPPVGLEVSPALDENKLSGYNLEVITGTLSDVVRQSEKSGILFNATEVRKVIANDGMSYGEGWPVRITCFSDVERVSGEELVEKVSDSYSSVGESETIIVTRSNKRANMFNEGIRRMVLYREDEICIGDMLMVVRNNYFWLGEEEGAGAGFIANGDTAEIVRIRRYEEMYGFRFADLTLRFIDYKDMEVDCKIFLDTLMLDTPSFNSDYNRRLFGAVSEDYANIKSRRKMWEEVRKNEYFNALQVKFAYAVTCHKSQGGQWKHVFIDHGYVVEGMLDKNYLRWMYTAFTRPTEKLFLVNFNSSFFVERGG